MNYNNLLEINIFFFVFVSSILIYFINIFTLFYLKKFQVLDLNELNNNKKIYTGLGVSLAIISLLYFLLFIIFADPNTEYYHIKFLPIPLSVFLIGIIGFWDDYKGTPVHLRLTIFFTCCFLSTASLSNNLIPFIQFHKLELILITLFWVYMINASNFMDGGDRYIVNSLLPNTLFFIFYFIYIDYDLLRAQINILLLIFVIHFSFYNKYPAKYFMGDSGSLVLGYLYSWNILHLIQNNEYLISIILSLFLLADVSITLLIRILNNKNIFSRHKGFLIHVAKFLKRKPVQIANAILFLNIILVILAIIYKLFFGNLLILFISLLALLIYFLYLLRFKISNIKFVIKN